ncbi:MAG: hypothetical protein ACI4RD_05645 [Kiritimatiellia bacterium]
MKARALLSLPLALAVLAAGPLRADWELRLRLTYPGAGVDAVARDVLPAVERALRTVDGVRSLRTVVRPESLVVTAKLAGDGQDRRTVRLDFAHRAEETLPELPPTVTDLRVEDVYLRSYPFVFAVSGRGTSMRELKLRALELGDLFLREPEVADVRLVGQEREVVALSLRKGRFLNECSVVDLKKMIEGCIRLEPAGAIDVGARRLRLVPGRALERLSELLDMSYTLLPKAGEQPLTVMLRDHLRLSLERSEKPPEALCGSDGRRCVLVCVALRDGGAGEGVVRALEAAQARAPLGVEIGAALDTRAPVAERTLAFDLRFRAGTRIESADASTRKLSEAVRSVAGVGRTLSVAGGMSLPLLPAVRVDEPAANQAVLIVSLAGEAVRGDVGREILALAGRLAPEALVMPREGFGPDACGVRMDYAVTDDDPLRLQRRADRLADAARASAGGVVAYCDWDGPVECLDYELYESKARQLGLTRLDIALACRSALDGMEVASCWERGDRLPVVLRIGADEIKGPQDLSTLWCYSPVLDRFVPFSQVVRRIRSLSEPGCRIRENGRYVATVRCLVADAAAAQSLRSHLDQTDARQREQGAGDARP